jgi:hypothetical protein
MTPASRLHAFLGGTGRDAAGRSLDDVLALDDRALEHIHDYIQWLFPLPTRSAAQPQSPVLTQADVAAIGADPGALANLGRASERMLAFYQGTRHWLARSDHNHLRISRIIGSLRLLAGPEAAGGFYDAVTALHRDAGSPIDPRNLGYWERAVRG